MKQITAALLVAAALSGCSTLSQMTSAVIPAKTENPPKALKDIKTTVAVRTVWQVSTGSEIGKDYVRIHPNVDESAVLVAGGRSASAWNKVNGGRIWQTTLDNDVTGGVNSGEGGVFIGTASGSAIALDRQTGKVRWSSPLGSEVLAVSPAKNGVVVFRTSNGGLHGLSAQDGQILWQQGRKSPTLSLRGTSTPIVVGGMVIAGFDNGVVTAFDMQSGKGLWEVTLSVPRGSSDLDRMTDVDGEMKALGEALFAASYNGRIAGINMRDGRVAWAAPYSSYTGVEADPNGLYTSSDTGDVWKLELLSGNPVWKLDDLQRRQPTAPALSGQYLVIGDYQGYLHWINTSNGQIAARTQGDKAGYTVAPVKEGNVVYSLGKSGLLSAFSIQ
ncbi:Beta-barrel assembly machine subunit BamB [Thiothrix caldifontis]|uniref:Outer membrane protein assembly factor BamB n=1 Tax=Thiothrix caldifontis TaxID=525918 RepID=A0A1H3YHS3_9GAMM|nr:outer membrane protein assembly factor BamB [Thiothrix caldifontis]SEA11105.1 Beta-barrel assembly machine subunit BamB [Thiothrix caldifontis]